MPAAPSPTAKRHKSEDLPPGFTASMAPLAAPPPSVVPSGAKPAGGRLQNASSAKKRSLDLPAAAAPPPKPQADDEDSDSDFM